jgi:hypothetical protein
MTSYEVSTENRIQNGKTRFWRRNSGWIFGKGIHGGLSRFVEKARREERKVQLMRLSTHRAGRKFGRSMAQLRERHWMDGVRITMQWDSDEVSPSDETGAEAVTTIEREVDALVYFVSEQAVTRGNAVYELGDAIISLPGGTQIDRPGLRFVLPNGGTYIHKTTGQAYEQFWDANFGAKPSGVTILLTKQP